MKVKYVVIIIFIIVIAIVLYTKFNGPDISGWNEFKNKAISNYNFVKDVNIDSVSPVQINITYNINRIPNEEEVDSIFEYTRNYLASEQTMQSFIKYHKKKYDYSFSRIKIILHLWEKDNKYDIEIYSSQSESGEPIYSYFREWDIKYNHEESKHYKTIIY